ncbi:MAG TPA: hypothetical protein VGH80_07530 [Xanthomonadaceae bacterium]|jgi:hypothetical protein
MAVCVFPIHFKGLAMNEEHLRQLARSLIQQQLATGPMKGATLKLRLLAEFARQADTPFDTAFRIYPKFSAFLAANADLVEIQRPPAGMSGDVTVRLRTTDSTATAGAATSMASEAALDRPLPREVWQAFTNPDPRRQRYFQKSTGKIVHFLADDAPPSPLDADDFERIDPISAAAQSGWMRQFVESNFAASPKRDELLAVAAIPYTSNLNHTFAYALGPFGEPWKRYRARYVQAAVRQWASRHAVALEALVPQPTRATTAPPATDAADALRQALIEAISAASPDELRLVQIPASLLLPRTRSDAR